MKTAKQLIEDYLNKGNNMPIEGMALLSKFECELLMEQYSSQVVNDKIGCTCTTSQCSLINGKYLCHTCNKPINEMSRSVGQTFL
jgi:hypothetical protein